MFLYFFRIRTETNGGAWCPKNRITQDSYEYLQIDLGRLTVITMVEIQGRFGNGQVCEGLKLFPQKVGFEKKKIGAQIVRGNKNQVRMKSQIRTEVIRKKNTYLIRMLCKSFLSSNQNLVLLPFLFQCHLYQSFFWKPISFLNLFSCRVPYVSSLQGQV